jgi:hypothetical protein
MLTEITLAGLMTGASFGPSKSLLRPSDENGHRKSLRKRTQAPFSYSRPRLYPLSPVSVGRVLHYFY